MSTPLPPKQRITDWPADERPREKLLKQGAAQLSDAELLAIFLRVGVVGMTAVDLARQMLHEYGDLQALLNADQKRFCATRGLGNAKYAQLQACMEMARRNLLISLHEAPVFNHPERVYSYLQSRLQHERSEVFAALYLNNQHHLIDYRELFRGTIDQSQVWPREVAKVALQLDAKAVIFAHNHPSGNTRPSEADHQITRRLAEALDLFDIRVLDHIIVGHGQPLSFREKGWL